jgi:hypothetical protein
MDYWLSLLHEFYFACIKSLQLTLPNTDVLDIEIIDTWWYVVKLRLERIQNMFQNVSFGAQMLLEAIKFISTNH